jgi:hypothetical protein
MSKTLIISTELVSMLGNPYAAVSRVDRVTAGSTVYCIPAVQILPVPEHYDRIVVLEPLTMEQEAKFKSVLRNPMDDLVRVYDGGQRSAIQVAHMEFDEEQFRERVEQEKERIRTHVPWWHRLLPFTVKIERRECHG